MINVEINDKKYEFPTDWSDITMQQYCKLFHNLPKTSGNPSEADKTIETIKNEALIISRLLGENDDFVENLPIEIFVRLQHHAMFLYNLNNFLESGTFTIKIDGKVYKMVDVENMSLRQYIDCDMIMKEEGENQFIELLSCLLVPVGGEYNGNYKELMTKVGNMKASEGLPFIYTFFKKKELSKKVSEVSSKVEQVADQLLHSTQGS